MRYLFDITAKELKETTLPSDVYPVLTLKDFTLEPVIGSSLSEILELSSQYTGCIDATGLVVEGRFVEFKQAIVRLLTETSHRILFSDLAVFNILNDNHMSNRGFYVPETLIMNRFDLNYYGSLGVTVGLSLENSQSELREMLANNTVPTLIDVWGYRRYLVTPRQVINGFNDGNGTHLPTSGLMRENNRMDWYHIEENEAGTWILSALPFGIRQSFLSENPLTYGRIKRYGATLEKRLQILNLYLTGRDAFSLGEPLKEAPMKGETVLTKVK